MVRIFSGSADFSVFLDLASNVIPLKSVFTETIFELFSGFFLKAVLTPEHGSKYVAHRHTLDPGGGVKRSNHIFL